MTIEKVIRKALEDIPLLRDGKKSVDALNSFHDDIEFVKKMNSSYIVGRKTAKELSVIWNEYFRMRCDEDFKTHYESKNRFKYQEMLD